MKSVRFLLLSLLSLMCSTMFAQRIIVQKFNADLDINQSYADSIEQLFIKHLESENFSVIERSLLDKSMIDNGFKSFELTKSEKRVLAKSLNTDMVISGNVSIVGKYYELKIHAFDANWEEDMIEDTFAWQDRGDYKKEMKDFVNVFASKAHVELVMFDLMIRTIKAQLGIRQ